MPLALAEEEDESIEYVVEIVQRADGTDGSLFIVSRLREERARGLPHAEAILNTASTATQAVVFSGTAFSLALLGMLLVPDTVLRSLALGAIVVARLPNLGCAVQGARSVPNAG